MAMIDSGQTCQFLPELLPLFAFGRKNVLYFLQYMELFLNETSWTCRPLRVTYSANGPLLWPSNFLSYLPLMHLVNGFWSIGPVTGISEWNYTDIYTIKGYIYIVMKDGHAAHFSSPVIWSWCFCTSLTIWNIWMKLLGYISKDCGQAS